MTSSIVLRSVSHLYETASRDQLRRVGRLLLGRAAPTETGNRMRALGDIDLEIAHGETVGLIGHNGAGKSTLLALIAGVMEPTVGTLDIQGSVTALLTLGVGTREDLTGRENVAIQAAITGSHHADLGTLEDDVQDFAELGRFFDLPVRTYSTGMKSRLAFAVATAVDPEILLLDETLAVGDAGFGAKAEARMKSLRERGSIVILAAHDMRSIRSMCDRCVWLDHGCIREDGPSEEVTSAYLEETRRADGRLLAPIAPITELPGDLVVEELEVLDDADVTTGLLRTGVPFAFRAAGHASERASQIDFRVERFDGLVLGVLPGEIRREGERWEAVAGLSALLLSAGFFVVVLEWVGEDGRFEVASTAFEVQTERMPVGGHPILLAPTTFETEFLG